MTINMRVLHLSENSSILSNFEISVLKFCQAPHCNLMNNLKDTKFLLSRTLEWNMTYLDKSELCISTVEPLYWGSAVLNCEVPWLQRSKWIEMATLGLNLGVLLAEVSTERGSTHPLPGLSFYLLTIPKLDNK